MINEVIFINNKGEEMPLSLKDPINPCYECPLEKGKSYEYIQGFSIPANPAANVITNYFK